MLTPEAISQYKVIYLKKFGVELSDDKAYELASRLLNLYRAVYAPESKLSINQKHETKVQSSQSSQ